MKSEFVNIFSPEQQKEFIKFFKVPHLIIGDIHGCYDEVIELITATKHNYKTFDVVSVGDLFDRGPKNEEVFRLFYNSNYKVVRGNHDDKLMRYCKGNKITIGDGLQATIDQLGLQDNPLKRSIVFNWINETRQKIENDYYIVCHAAPDYPHMFGTKHDYNGKQIRFNWWDFYEGKLCIYGHYWFKYPRVIQKQERVTSVGIDTSCVMGGGLTGLVLPYGELITIESKKYIERTKEDDKLFNLEEEAWEFWKNDISNRTILDK